MHDFRRTVATGMQKLRIEERVIEAVLGHSTAGLRRVYQVHAFDSEKREALDLWGAHVMKLVDPPMLKRRAL